MIRKLFRFLLSLLTLAATLYFVFFVPLGRYTLWEHIWRIAQTPEARELGRGAGQTAVKATEKVGEEFRRIVAERKGLQTGLEGRRARRAGRAGEAAAKACWVKRNAVWVCCKAKAVMVTPRSGVGLFCGACAAPAGKEQAKSTPSIKTSKSKRLNALIGDLLSH